MLAEAELKDAPGEEDASAAAVVIGTAGRLAPAAATAYDLLPLFIIF